MRATIALLDTLSCFYTAQWLMSKITKHNYTKAVTIDGIEGEYARIELPDGTIEDWRLDGLPDDVKEGDVVQVRAAKGGFEMQIDHEATRLRQAQAQQELTALNSATPTGEIDL